MTNEEYDRGRKCDPEEITGYRIVLVSVEGGHGPGDTWPMWELRLVGRTQFHTRDEAVLAALKHKESVQG